MKVLVVAEFCRKAGISHATYFKCYVAVERAPSQKARKLPTAGSVPGWPEPRKAPVRHAVAGLFALQLATPIRGYFVQENRGIQIGASDLGQAFDAKCCVDTKLRFGFRTEGREWSGGNSAGVSQAVLVG